MGRRTEMQQSTKAFTLWLLMNSKVEKKKEFQGRLHCGEERLCSEVQHLKRGEICLGYGAVASLKFDMCPS